MATRIRMLLSSVLKPEEFSKLERIRTWFRDRNVHYGDKTLYHLIFVKGLEAMIDGIKGQEGPPPQEPPQ
jgi:hypothetical protein